MKFARNEKGFSLAEVIISLGIVLIIVLANLVFCASLKRNIRQLEATYTATNLASSQIEDLKGIAVADGFDDSDLRDGSHGATTLNLSPDVAANFTVTYDVEDREDWSEDGMPPSDTDAEYKVITATCRYNNDTDEVRLTGFIVR